MIQPPCCCSSRLQVCTRFQFERDICKFARSFDIFIWCWRDILTFQVSSFKKAKTVRKTDISYTPGADVYRCLRDIHLRNTFANLWDFCRIFLYGVYSTSSVLTFQISSFKKAINSSLNRYLVRTWSKRLQVYTRYL